jgi:hypothetical protein
MKLLKTPSASDAHSENLKSKNVSGTSGTLAQEMKSGFIMNRLLPTPTVSDVFTGNLKSSQQKEGSMHSVTLPQVVRRTLTLSPGASPASLFPQPESEKGQMMTATCGRRCLESYQSLSRHGAFVKMFVEYLLLKGDWYSNKCALTWKVSATKFSRLLFQLAPSTPRTDEIGFGLLLTPVATNIESGDDRTEKRMAFRASIGRTTYCPAGLSEQLAMLPTPRAGNPGSRPNGKGGKILAEEITKLLPTPHGNAMTGAGEHGTGGPNIQTAVGTKTGLKLQPAFVEWMMGYPQGWTDLNCPNRDIGWNG